MIKLIEIFLVKHCRKLRKLVQIYLWHVSLTRFQGLWQNDCPLKLSFCFYDLRFCIGDLCWGLCKTRAVLLFYLRMYIKNFECWVFYCQNFFGFHLCKAVHLCNHVFAGLGFWSRKQQGISFGKYTHKW